jgi:hypothetical protein
VVNNHLPENYVYNLPLNGAAEIKQTNYALKKHVILSTV